MKKLGKLNLKAEKMLSHDELVSFRGGSGSVTDCPSITAAVVTNCHNDCWSGSDNARYRNCMSCCRARACGGYCA